MTNRRDTLRKHRWRIAVALFAWVTFAIGITHLPLPGSTSEWPSYPLTDLDSEFSGVVTRQDVDRGMSVLWVDSLPHRIQGGFWPSSKQATGMAHTTLVGATVTKCAGTDTVWVEFTNGQRRWFRFLQFASDEEVR